MALPVLGKDPVFWEVDGIPVAALPTPEGGVSVRAFDVPEGRPFKPSLAYADGTPISAEAFERLKESFQAAEASKATVKKLNSLP